MIEELNKRSRDILKLVVESYVANGEPVSSSSIASKSGLSLSPATIRNVMADMERTGLLYSPHTSAGRLPTATGLKIFVDGLLEVSTIAPHAKKDLRKIVDRKDKSIETTLENVSQTLSGLASCAGIVMAPKLNNNIKQIEFVYLAPGRILAILVSESGLLENRVIETDKDFPASALPAAANYINSQLQGHTLTESRLLIEKDIFEKKTQLDVLSQKLVQQGLAVWSNADGGRLIVKGQSHLLNNIMALEDLEKIKNLFDSLETTENLVKLLTDTERADGVQIFIGAENSLFDYSGCSMIVAPYKNNQEEVIGAIGVIGPSRLNYARIIPMVNYTSQLLSKMIG